MGKKTRYASVEAQGWLRHFSTLLFASSTVPAHLGKTLLIPDGNLHSRWVLSRAEANLGLWARFYKPLTTAQQWTRSLSVYVDLNHELSSSVVAYLVHACATASATRLKEIHDELTLTGQLELPVEFQKAPRSPLYLQKVYAALKKSEIITSPLPELP